MNRDANLFGAVAGSALVLAWSVPLAAASMATVLLLGKSGYIIALGGVPVVGAFGASLTSRRVARVAWRLAIVGPTIMLATLGALVLAGWSLFSVDTAYWEPPVAGLGVLFAINSLVVANGTPERTGTSNPSSEVQ